MAITGLKCFGCGREHQAAKAPYACPSCGENLQVCYDEREAKRRLGRRRLADCGERSLWRYLPLLPVDAPPRSPMQVGWTPLYDAPRLARALGIARLRVKDDTRNPSASLKDRASAIVTARAAQARERVIATASTGNAASSLACLAAGSGVRAVIFVPQTAPPAKLAQLLVFGATVFLVEGSYDDAFELCVEACREFGWYNRNTGLNPYTREGKKTCAFELCEQAGWEVPDWVFVPAGDGNILSGVWKGLREFRALGLIDRLPRLAAVQAEGSDSIASAFEEGGSPRPVRARTLADSISVSLPRDGEAAVRALRQSNGVAVRVPDAELLDAMVELARGCSVFAEPAGAAGYAGLKRAAASGVVKAGDSVAVLATGSGLKDVESARRAGGEAHRVEPELGALKKALRRIPKARMERP